MDDDKIVKDQDENVDADKTDDLKTDNLDDIKSQIKAELEAEFSKREAEYKQKISKLDRVITEKDREKLSEVERMKAEKEDIEREKETLRKEAEDFRRKLAIDSALNEAGLPLDLAERVKGESPDDIKDDVLKLKTYFDNLINKSAEAQIAAALKGSPPHRQDDVKGKLTYDDIVKIPDREERIKAYKANGFM